MTRPKGMLGIGIWIGIYGGIHLMGLRRAVSGYSPQSGVPAAVMIGGIALLIWEIYGLRSLYALQRWIAVGVFSWWGISMILKIPLIQSPPIVSATMVMVLRLQMLGIAIVNTLAIWYLVRPSFRRRCIQFVEEQKLQKNLLK